VDQSREMCRVAEQEIVALQREIDQIKREMDEIGERYYQLENKYRDTVYLNEGARDHLGGLHRMHVKLLATRQMEECLCGAFNR